MHGAGEAHHISSEPQIMRANRRNKLLSCRYSVSPYCIVSKQVSVIAPSVVRTKRIVLGIAAILECLIYYYLTEARFSGQGLEPELVRFTTLSDRVSLVLFAFYLFLIIRTFITPSRISLRRIVMCTVALAIIFWITLGADNFEVGEFPRTASFTYLLTRAFYVGLFFARKEYDFHRFSGFRRVVFNTIIVFGMAILVAFFFSFTYPFSNEMQELRQYDADAAVILGAAVWHGSELGERPSPTLAERITSGAELIKKEAVPKLVVTGSNAPNERSEAEVAKRELVAMGIDPSVIVTESSSRSTIEQVIYIRNELMNRQQWKRFVIVSDQYHLARVLEMCKFNGIDAIGMASGIKQEFYDLLYYRLRESIALIAYWILGK